MTHRRESSDTAVTRFLGDINFDEQNDTIHPTTTLTKRSRSEENETEKPSERLQLDDPQISWPPKSKRHKKTPKYDVAGADSDESPYDSPSPLISPGIKSSVLCFVPQDTSGQEPQPDSLHVKRTSPWEHYTKAYRRELGASVVVACKIPATFDLFAIKCTIRSEGDDIIQAFRRTRHANFVTCYEIFMFEDALFTVSECMALSLSDLNGSPISPNEIQIATIVHEVLVGIDFLVSQDMIHGDITCSNILLALHGDVKIGEAFPNPNRHTLLISPANPESCSSIHSNIKSVRDDTEALGFVMSQLMERGRSYRKGLVLKHPDRWSREARTFLQSTETSSASELLLYPFLKNSPQKAELVSLISCAQISSVSKKLQQTHVALAELYEEEAERLEETGDVE